MSTPTRIAIDVSREEAALILSIRNLGYGYIEGINVQKGVPIQWKCVVNRVDLTKGSFSEDIEALAQAISMTNPDIRRELGQILSDPTAEEKLKDSEDLGGDQGV